MAHVLVGQADHGFNMSLAAFPGLGTKGRRVAVDLLEELFAKA